MSEANAHRIFFALWPDDALRQQLKQSLTPLLANAKGQRVPAHNWHITLAFLGNVTQSVCECAQIQASEVVGQTFDLTLDQFGFWPRPRVAWLGCSVLPDRLNALVNKLNIALQMCEYTPQHPTYTPHLTLLRKAGHALAVDSLTPVYWQVDDFVLVESLQTKAGSVYEVIKRWPLSASTTSGTPA